MKRAKNGLALCMALLLLLTPMLALASRTIVFTVKITSGDTSRTKTISVLDTMTVQMLYDIIRSEGGVWSTGLAMGDALGDHFPGSAYDLTVSAGPSPWGNMPYTHFTPFSYGVGPAPEPDSISTGGARPGNPTSRDTTGDGKATPLDGISWSEGPMYQVRVNGQSIDFRLRGDGEQLAFTLRFDRNAAGAARMNLRVENKYSNLRPVCSAAAVEFLKNLGVAEVRVISGKGWTSYNLDQLTALAK